jgi:hypothetical protein
MPTCHAETFDHTRNCWYKERLPSQHVLLHDQALGLSCVAELSLLSGRRADLVALGIVGEYRHG